MFFCFFKTISSEVSSDPHECSAENGVRPILPWSAAGTKPDPITAKDVSLDLISVKLFVWFKDQLVQSLYWSHYIDESAKKTSLVFGLGLALFGENRPLERFPMSDVVCRLWHCWNSRLFFVNSQLGSGAVNKILGCILHCLLGIRYIIIYKESTLPGNLLWPNLRTLVRESQKFHEELHANHSDDENLPYMTYIYAIFPRYTWCIPRVFPAFNPPGLQIMFDKSILT